jgi:hypothetical protein
MYKGVTQKFVLAIFNPEAIWEFINEKGINCHIGELQTTPNSVYKQLLSVPVRAYKVSFSTNKVGLGPLLKAVVSRYRSAMVHATAHTRERCG